jgi:hypothetical protein
LETRASGGSWPQPGDPLQGKSAEYLSCLADQAAAEGQSLERAKVGDIRIDTDGRTVNEAVDLIGAATGSLPDEAVTHV